MECDINKGKVFGVPLSLLMRHTPDDIPFVVRRCTAEIESRALSLQVLFFCFFSQFKTVPRGFMKKKNGRRHKHHLSFMNCFVFLPRGCIG